MTSQPRTELVLGEPLQVNHRDDETIVGVHDRDGSWQELKRFSR